MNKQGLGSLLGVLPRSHAASLPWFHFHKRELDLLPSLWFFSILTLRFEILYGKQRESRGLDFDRST